MKVIFVGFVFLKYICSFNDVVGDMCVELFVYSNSSRWSELDMCKWRVDLDEVSIIRKEDELIENKGNYLKDF